MKKRTILYWGSELENARISVTRKLCLADAFYLSILTLQDINQSVFQYIHVYDKGNNSVFLWDKGIKITFSRRTMQIMKGDYDLSEEEVFDALSDFVIKVGKRVTMFGMFPYKKDDDNNKEDL